MGTIENIDARDYIDSLETRLILEKNEKKLLILDELIPYYFRNEPLQAAKMADKMLSIALQENNKKYKIKAQRYKGISNSYLKSDYEAAFKECEKVEFNAKANGFIDELILIKLDFADIYKQVGELTKALEYQIEAYHLADSAKMSDLISITLNSQAQSYIELDDLDKAEQCLKRSLKHAKLHEQHEVIAETNIIFGDLYEKAFNHQSALEHYVSARETYLNLRKDIQIAIAVFKIAKCHFSMNEQDKSFKFHLNALTIRNRIKDRTGLAESYNEIGLLCLENGEYQRAINNVKLGLNNAEMINSNILMHQSFDYLYQGYLKLEDFEKAQYYQNKFIGIGELIYAEASERKIKEIENKNEIEIRDQQIENLEKLKNRTEQQLAASERFIITLTLLLAVILISVFIFIKYYRDKRKINDELKIINDKVLKQNEKLIELNSTKDKFFTIIGHDLKGPLNSLTSFSQLLINHTASLTEEEIRTIAKDLDKSLKNLYELLENLLGWALSQTGKIEFKLENFKISEIIRENIRLLSKAAVNKKIKVELLIDDRLLVYADKNSIRTVIRNILSNAIKFTPEEGFITIFVDEWKDSIEIGIKDNGIGIIEEDLNKIFDISAKHTTLGTNKEKGTGLGLILCKEFVERNGGSIAVKSEFEVGTTLTFTLQKQREPEVQVIEPIKA